MLQHLKILETFRDAVQGLDRVVSTDHKVAIIDLLAGLGFDYLDVGTFVNPQVIPQFKDMDQVLKRISTTRRQTKLFILVANASGGERALAHEAIDVIGFPFSTSPVFLHKNIHATPVEAFTAIRNIQEGCLAKGKEMMVYLAMAFGNPYGDPVGVDVCLECTRRFHEMGICEIHLSDITGVAKSGQIAEYFQTLGEALPGLEFGLHLHIKHHDDWHSKLTAAYESVCRTFDGVISGLGGCPMTGYEMLQNIPSDYLE